MINAPLRELAKVPVRKPKPALDLCGGFHSLGSMLSTASLRLLRLQPEHDRAAHHVMSRLGHP